MNYKEALEYIQDAFSNDQARNSPVESVGHDPTASYRGTLEDLKVMTPMKDEKVDKQYFKKKGQHFVSNSQNNTSRKSDHSTIQNNL